MHFFVVLLAITNIIFFTVNSEDYPMTMINSNVNMGCSCCYPLLVIPANSWVMNGWIMIIDVNMNSQYNDNQSYNSSHYYHGQLTINCLLIEHESVRSMFKVSTRKCGLKFHVFGSWAYFTNHDMNQQTQRNRNQLLTSIINQLQL